MSNPRSISALDVIHRIELLTLQIMDSISDNTLSTPHNDSKLSTIPIPTIRSLPSISHSPNTIPTRTLTNLSTCRSFASLTLILCFVHSLLLQGRTTSTREVFYFFVTHFRSQKECDGCILDVARLLGVTRVSLGLTASPKGKEIVGSRCYTLCFWCIMYFWYVLWLHSWRKYRSTYSLITYLINRLVLWINQYSANRVSIIIIIINNNTNKNDCYGWNVHIFYSRYPNHKRMDTWCYQ